MRELVVRKDTPSWGTKAAFDSFPAWPMTKMVLGVLISQMPRHQPERGLIPAYYNEWLVRWARGDDMSNAQDLSPALALA